MAKKRRGKKKPQPGLIPKLGDRYTPLERAYQEARRALLRERKALRKGRRHDYAQYLRSEAWAQIREEVLRRDDWVCQQCGTRRNLHVHHVHYRTFKRETGDELLTLCRSCHENEHQGDLELQEDRRLTQIQTLIRLSGGPVQRQPESPTPVTILRKRK